MIRAICALALLVSTACVHLTGSIFRPPPTFGYFGIQCVPTRQLVCVTDPNFTEAMCVRVMVPAIRAVNAAVGRHLVQYAGAVERHDATMDIESLSGHIAVGGEILPGRIAGVTYNWHEAGTPEYCITGSKILLDPGIYPMGIAGPVGLHELLHALGADHAEPGSSFKSIMAPSLDSPSYMPSLSTFDRVALQAVYGR